MWFYKGDGESPGVCLLSGIISQEWISENRGIVLWDLQLLFDHFDFIQRDEERQFGTRVMWRAGGGGLALGTKTRRDTKENSLFRFSYTHTHICSGLKKTITSIVVCWIPKMPGVCMKWPYLLILSSLLKNVIFEIREKIAKEMLKGPVPFPIQVASSCKALAHWNCRIRIQMTRGMWGHALRYLFELEN